MVLKVRTAKAAQRDHNFVLIARTDARDVNGLEDAIRRVNLYGEAGADVVSGIRRIRWENSKRSPGRYLVRCS